MTGSRARKTGLGLSQAYGIARQTGGTVRIKSQPGAGTTARINLRKTLAAPDASRAEEPAEASQAIRSAKFISSTTTPTFVSFSLNLLKPLGCEVVEALDGPSGLAMFDQVAPDLMIVDFAMPT